MNGDDCCNDPKTGMPKGKSLDSDPKTGMPKNMPASKRQLIDDSKKKQEMYMEDK